MFVREKRVGAYSYLYLVETVRENGKTKQRIIHSLGRTEDVEARGGLDRLARSAARLSQRTMILSLLGDDGVPKLSCRRIGAALLFERLWIESGCRGAVEEMLVGRRFEFAVERAVFLTVLHRLMVSGSDRACEHWREDYRPHLKQMIVGVIMDQAGRPVCSEMWPGNTADVTTLVLVIDRLRQRFAIGKVCVVADRGMISAETIANLEARGLEYILGERERSSNEVRQIVLNDPKPSVPLIIPRGSRPDTELEAKEVRVGSRRYVVCRNLNEAQRDALLRESVLKSLRASLRSGDKSLVSNSAYRRYLKTPAKKHFEIDEQRVAEDARYDGLYVLRTNTSLNPLAVMLRYRELLKVEDIFRTTKAILDTRPIYHQRDATIRGHVFCSFLALVLRKALEDRLAAARMKTEWGALIRELDRLQEVETEQDGKRFILRTPATGDVGNVFRAVGVALPPNIRDAEASQPAD